MNKIYLKGAFASFLWVIALTVIMFYCNSCTAQVPRVLAWDYDFTQYADSSIYFVLYQKIDTDTGFTVFDTTGAQVLEYELLQYRPLYNFSWRSWRATAVQHDPAWHDTLWSYESLPSNTVRVFFKALPPAPIDSIDGLNYETIKVGDIPQL
jgi:hypothetical protein